jgi:hypothetical protein
MAYTMHPPDGAKCLPFPVHLKPYMVAGIRALREELRADLGEPHFVETDSTRTFGGDEDNWAWELASGQRFLLVLQVPYGRAIIYCDPPDPKPVILSLGIDADRQQLEFLPTPIVHPGYTGP